MLDSISFFRIIKTGFVNFWRNLWLSAAATMVMTITLVIFSILFLLFVLTGQSIKSVQNTVDISVYMKKGLAEKQVLEIKSSLEQDPKIKTVVYKSPEQAKTEFLLTHDSEDEIIKAFNELDENPLLGTLNIKTVNLQDYPYISEKLKDQQYSTYIDKVSFDDSRTRAIIDKLNKALNLITRAGLTLVAIFSIIAILVIYNTITLTIYNRKEEVEIMRLVGATNSYIRGPFLTEAILYSLFSTIFTAIFLAFIFVKVLPQVTAFVNPELKVSDVNLFNYWYLVLSLCVVGIFLAVFSTWLAIRKYLKI